MSTRPTHDNVFLLQRLAYTAVGRSEIKGGGGQVIIQGSSNSFIIWECTCRAPRSPGSVGPKLELQIMMASSFESNIHEDLEEEIMNLVDAQAAPDRLKRHTG